VLQHYSGLLVVAVAQLIQGHQLLVVVEVLHRELLIHMQVQALVLISQIQELQENLLKLTVDLVVVDLAVIPLLFLREGEDLDLSLSHILLDK
jgi:hypothetical protein